MTKDDFNRWWKMYREAFPEVANRLANLEDGGKPTLTHWLRAFGDVDYADAVEVVNQMVDGRLEPVDKFEIGATASVVRRHAREMAYNRRQPDRDETKPWKSTAPRAEKAQQVAQAGVMGQAGMKAALEEYARLKDAGATQQECRAMLRKRFPEDRNDRRERYRCLRCMDTGYARVWHQDSMIAVLNGTIGERTHRKTAAIPCECENGRSKVGISRGDKRKPLFERFFDPKLDVSCIDPDDPDAIEELTTWCKAKKAGPTRYAEFDAYNERPF